MYIYIYIHTNIQKTSIGDHPIFVRQQYVICHFIELPTGLSGVI